MEPKCLHEGITEPYPVMSDCNREPNSFGPKGNQGTKVLGLEAIIELRHDESDDITQPRDPRSVPIQNQDLFCLNPIIEPRPPEAKPNQGTKKSVGLKGIQRTRPVGPEEITEEKPVGPEGNHRT